ncbi:flavin-containing superfamily amine oxidase, partial [Coniochaeta sp. 2T2.1]
IALAFCVFSLADGSSCDPGHLTRDVVIIGGGASGAHAAIRLQGMGYTVALIEKTGQLGGHVDTIIDPQTGKTFDISVSFFENTTHSREFMSELDIELVNATTTAQTPGFSANFHTDGKIVDPVPSSIPYTNFTAVGLALFGWVQQLQRFPFLENGFELPYPVPEDLLLPCGDFLKKYDLGALASALFSTAQGVGNILAQPTLYILKTFTLAVADSALGGLPLMTTPDQNNQAIYDSAARKLGDNVFLNSDVKRINRQAPNKVSVSMKTPNGNKVIRGKKLLIAIEPSLNNLRGLGLDLDQEEQRLFGQLNNSIYWPMVVRNSGIPQSAKFTPIDLAAPFGIPETPIVESIMPNTIGAPDLTLVYFSSPDYMSDQDVQKQVLATIAKIVEANGFDSTGRPEFVAFERHDPFQATVPAAAIREGFYKKMNLLQGGRDTFYTGAAWQAPNSAQIWAYNNEILLPQLVEALES